MFARFLTRHALTQSQRRGKSAPGVRLVMRYGRLRDGRFLLTGRDVRREVARRQRWLARARLSDRRRRALKKRIETLEKMRGCAVVVSEEGDVLTVYNETRKRLRNRTRRRRKYRH